MRRNREIEGEEEWEEDPAQFESWDYLRALCAPGSIPGSVSDHSLRILELMSLAFNFSAGLAIISLNKALFNQLCMRAGMLERKRFTKGNLADMLIVVLVVALAPIASNKSLYHNSTATYQLFKLLQTPVVAAAEVVLGVRSMSILRFVFLSGIVTGVGFAEIEDGLTISWGVLWAMAAVMLSSTLKGWTPAQLLLEVMPWSAALQLILVAVLGEYRSLSVFVKPVEEGGLGSGGMILFLSTGMAAFLVTWSQGIAVGTTSALSHALMGQAKTAGLTVLSAVLLHERISARQMMGGSAAMLSLVLYSWVNVREGKRIKHNN
ncbi:hypothetical protein GUITHDRAFT_119656 [Guillardia theta CCMP2712]|uniref:Sugar phosphate transporter domain-containing protein n=1 Tax=Guillardia theta (strain CCMP2712) TaxID=905079 RepID=L1IDH2_GUITC|nr:hypothetical protein GUITHDRAFT_119656 [Guillardia theta CCMP2712]EKX34162.1 hypothetical protein GUITHDRAFT_119656 [Guillardia theta CCMP2712]|eukprot:XP_005821142.1 hypothetical protein GUITHDRAFT_119656 [Guillardia theta CCMP2712]